MVIGARTLLFVAVSVINLCRIDQPSSSGRTATLPRDHETGSLDWKFLGDEIKENRVIVLELVHVLDGCPMYKPYGDFRLTRSLAEEPCLGWSNWTVPISIVDPKRVAYTPVPVVKTPVSLSPCQPEDAPRTLYQSLAGLPIRSAVWIVVVVTDIIGFLVISQTGGRHPGTGKTTRTVAMLEGQVLDSLPSQKLRDDSCVIVNLSPSNSNEELISDDEETFPVLNI